MDLQSSRSQILDMIPACQIPALLFKNLFGKCSDFSEFDFLKSVWGFSFFDFHHSIYQMHFFTVCTAWGWNTTFICLFPQHLNTWSPRHMNIGTSALSALDWSFISALPGWGRALFLIQIWKYIHERKFYIVCKCSILDISLIAQACKVPGPRPWLNLDKVWQRRRALVFKHPEGPAADRHGFVPCLFRNSCLPSCWSVAQRWSRESGQLAPQVQLTWVFLTVPPVLFFSNPFCNFVNWPAGVFVKEDARCREGEKKETTWYRKKIWCCWDNKGSALIASSILTGAPGTKKPTRLKPFFPLHSWEDFAPNKPFAACPIIFFCGQILPVGTTRRIRVTCWHICTTRCCCSART